MTLVYPNALLFLGGLPIIILIQFREYRTNRADLMKIGGFWDNEDVRSVFFIKWLLSSLMINLTWIFLVLSLAGISWGEEPIEEDRAGLDVVFLVDVSYSMLAEDIEPSRIGRAREVIRGIAENFPGSRFALVAFKGDGTVLLPTTEDIYALENSLRYLNTEVISTPGTNIQAALDTALDALPEGSSRHRIVVLFSDGEALSGQYQDSAIEAGRRGIPVFTYGLGTREGTTIRQSDGSVVRDSSGNPVVTRLDGGTLMEIASLSGGEYFETSLGYSSLEGEIHDLVGQRNTDGFRLMSISRYRLFLLLALLSYFSAILVRQIKIRGLF